MILATSTVRAGASVDPSVAALRSMALDGLRRMYDRSAGLFCFRVRRQDQAAVREGLSRRYTAMTLIGLHGEDPDVAREIMEGARISDVAAHLTATVGPTDSLGDLALIAWAAHLIGVPADSVWDRIGSLGPVSGAHPTVEVAWVLSAAAVTPRARAALGPQLARRLQAAFSQTAGVFPHRLGPVSGGRAHVSCFADLVYPVLALAQYGEAAGDDAAIACSVAGAKAMCAAQGADGQWWWHFDYRTGRVIEHYPVYAVHQDAMAPMALFAAASAAGIDVDAAVARGLGWLWRAPELDGGSLVDSSHGLIWRKVARREPGKLSRYVQAGASRISRGWRTPGLDALFPPQAIDYEDRPYHLGWLLFAWPAPRAAVWVAR